MTERKREEDRKSEGEKERGEKAKEGVGSGEREREELINILPSYYIHLWNIQNHTQYM